MASIKFIACQARSVSYSEWSIS